MISGSERAWFFRFWVSLMRGQVFLQAGVGWCSGRDTFPCCCSSDAVDLFTGVERILRVQRADVNMCQVFGHQASCGSSV